MATSPWSWESKRWTALASLAVLAGLYAVVWYLMGGCERTPQGPTDSPADPTLGILEAMTDANVAETLLHVAWFHATRGRLPADLDELRKADPPAGWPPTPVATTGGRALAYRPTGDETYELTLAAKDGTTGDLRLAMRVPADMPTGLALQAVRTWWDLEHTRGMLETIRERLNRPEPAGN